MHEHPTVMQISTYAAVYQSTIPIWESQFHSYFIIIIISSSSSSNSIVKTKWQNNLGFQNRP
jgi:hypothetical protein